MVASVSQICRPKCRERTRRGVWPAPPSGSRALPPPTSSGTGALPHPPPLGPHPAVLCDNDPARARTDTQSSGFGPFVGGLTSPRSRTCPKVTWHVTRVLMADGPRHVRVTRTPVRGRQVISAAAHTRVCTERRPGFQRVWGSAWKGTCWTASWFWVSSVGKLPLFATDAAAFCVLATAGMCVSECV